MAIDNDRVSGVIQPLQGVAERVAGHCQPAAIRPDHAPPRPGKIACHDHEPLPFRQAPEPGSKDDVFRYSEGAGHPRALTLEVAVGAAEAKLDEQPQALDQVGHGPGTDPVTGRANRT